MAHNKTAATGSKTEATARKQFAASKREATARAQFAAQMQNREMHSRSLLKCKEVQWLTRLSRSAIYRKGADGTFPRPIKLGESSSAWRWSDIEAWLDSRESGVGA